MAKFLVLVDTPSIHKFVFGTDKLAEIAGASGLLDYLNRTQTPEILKPLSPTTIYCNGGKGLFVTDASEEEIKIALQNLQNLYLKETKGGAHVVCSYVPYTEPSGYQEALYLAHQVLEENRAHRATTFVSPHSAFMKECESCGQNPAEEFDAKKEQWICPVCTSKRAMHKEQQIQRIWRELLEYLRAKQDIIEEARWYDLRPKNFEEIAECYGSGCIGLVYADGNAMGKILRELDSPDVTRLFSKAVDDAIREACFQALSQLCYVSEKQKLYGDILLLGGDDLVVAVPAENAVKFALAVAQNFQTLTREAIAAACRNNRDVAFFFSGAREIVRQQGLTLGVGVVIGKAGQPFHMLLGQAEELLHSAKRGAAAKVEELVQAAQKKGMTKDAAVPLTPTYIDFHDATQSVFSTVAAVRKFYWMKTLPGQTRWWLTMRPYHIDDLQKLCQHAENLKKKDWPNSKLSELQSACFETPRKLYHTLISMLSRVKPEQHQALLDALQEFHHADLLSFFLARQSGTPSAGEEQSLMLVDLLELASYLEKETV